jgi:hypothetical protein
VQRRLLLLRSPLIPLGILVSRYLRASGLQSVQPTDYQEQAIRLNELAGNIHSVEDARALVDFVVELFQKQLPPAFVSSSSLSDKVARAEFAAVSSPQHLIPESRVAELWNTYVQTIQAPQESQVTVAEIHNLRDALFTGARLSWMQGRRAIWAVPTIYSTQDNGSMASGCRAIECIRIFWDLANIPANLAAARVRISQGVLNSELLGPDHKDSSAATQHSYVVSGTMPRNLIQVATREYVTKNGMRALIKAMHAMLDRAIA